MALHKTLTGSEIHAVHAFSYASAAARDAATGLTASDIGKIAIQTDDNSFWILQSYSPVTWASVASTGVGSSLAGHIWPGGFSGHPMKAVVSFTLPFPSSNYAITLGVVTDGTKTFTLGIESKTAGGFTVNLNSNNVANLVEVDWQAVEIGG